MDLLESQNLLETEKRRRSTRRTPVVVIVERRILIQSCVLRLLKRELAKYQVWGARATSDLSHMAGQDVRLIAVDIENRPFTESSVLLDFRAMRDLFPQAPVVVISDREDDLTAQDALHWGIRGFFPSSSPIDVVIAGFRLVLAGGVYYPPLVGARIDVNSGHNGLPTIIGSAKCGEGPIANGMGADERQPRIALTPRETEVIAELRIGHSNKVIALNLGMSENTVKMHIQHLMRKLGARTRTEAVFVWARDIAIADHENQVATQ